MTERELYEHVLEDPQRHWGPFAEQYGPLIERCVRFSGIAHRNWEDALQDVYYELLRHGMARLRKWSPERGSLSAFLRVVVCRILIDICRSSRYRCVPQPWEDPDSEGDYVEQRVADDGPLARETAEEGERAVVFGERLDRLVAQGRIQATDALILKYKFYGFDAKEIAEALGKSENAINVRFHRLKERLQGRLGQEVFGDL